MEEAAALIRALAALAWPAIVLFVLVRFEPQMRELLSRIKRGKIAGAEIELSEKLDNLLAAAMPDYQKTPGNRGVYVFRRTVDDTAHFLLLTLWDSLDVIREFAGDDVERARYYPEDEEYLLELEPTVTHYEVLASPE